jgi:hypothetical protein
LKKIIFPVLFGLACLFSSATGYSATLLINAPKVEVELEPGGTYSGEINVENPTDTVASLKAYLEDWMYSTGEGDKNFAPPGTMPMSASPWITFAAPEPTLPPFGRAVVRYTVRIPEGATGAHYSVLFFETVIGNMPDKEGVSVDVAGRIGALFIVEAKGTVKRDGEIVSLEIAPPEGNKPMEIHTKFKNSGNVHISLEGSFLILDEAGQVRARGELSKLYTFPDQTVDGTSKWVGRLPKGNYTVIATYNLGKGKSLVEERALAIA